jgi:ketosteroid isomerase-like protein
MKQLLSLIAFSVLIGATPAQPPAQIMALTHVILDASNANDDTPLVGSYTDDAIVIDENPPFVWRGASAGTQWFSGVQSLMTQTHASLHAVAAAPTDFQMDREGDDAYLSQKFAVSVTASGKTNTERGTMTYTFHKGDDGTWRISRQIWTTAASRPVKPNPATQRSASQMMDAFNKRAPNAMVGLYTSSATFVDDLSPFVWNGANAGARWYAKAMKYLKANGVASIHGVLGTPVESSVHAGAAYVIVPVTWSGTAQGKPFTQRGTYTITLKQNGSNWLITSQTWLAS